MSMSDYAEELRDIAQEALTHNRRVIWHRKNKAGEIIQHLRATIDREPGRGVNGYVRLRIPQPYGKVLVRHARYEDIEVTP